MELDSHREICEVEFGSKEVEESKMVLIIKGRKTEWKVKNDIVGGKVCFLQQILVCFCLGRGHSQWCAGFIPVSALSNHSW